MERKKKGKWNEKCERKREERRRERGKGKRKAWAAESSFPQMMSPRIWEEKEKELEAAQGGCEE